MKIFQQISIEFFSNIDKKAYKKLCFPYKKNTGTGCQNLPVPVVAPGAGAGGRPPVPVVTTGTSLIYIYILYPGLEILRAGAGDRYDGLVQSYTTRA